MSESRVLVGFKAPADLVEWIDSAARAEGISRSAWTRRLAIRERQAKQEAPATEKAA